MSGAARKLALSVIVVAALGGATLGMAVAGGHLHFLTATKPPLKASIPVPLSVNRMAPGDTAQRVVTMTNRSSRTIRRIRMSVGATSLLAKDRNGLRIRVQGCATAWLRLRTAAPTYKCRSRVRLYVGSHRLPVVRYTLGHLPPIKPGKKLYLLVSVTLPRSAGNNLQNQRAVLVPKFTATG